MRVSVAVLPHADEEGSADDGKRLLGDGRYTYGPEVLTEESDERRYMS